MRKLVSVASELTSKMRYEVGLASDAVCSVPQERGHNEHLPAGEFYSTQSVAFCEKNYQLTGSKMP